jgi:predicted kinase
MRQICSKLDNFHILDEGEMMTIGPYTVGCYSNHAVKTQDFANTDGRYLEMAMSTVKQAKEKGKIPVMISHYPVNPRAATLLGKTGLVAYLSGHIHCTDAQNSTSGNGINLDWYNQSAVHTDNKVIEGCFFSTGTTDIVQVTHNQSFKEIKVLEVVPPPKKEPKVKEVKVDSLYKRSPEVLVLVGLPGSGKSCIAKILQNKYGYVRINQDEMGNRNACIKAADAALKEGKGVVIDRCNVDVEQRAHWIKLAHEHGLKARSVVLSLTKDEAMARILKRKDHPTVKTQADAENAMLHMERKWKLPDDSEGFVSLSVLQAEGNSANDLADNIAESQIGN